MRRLYLKGIVHPERKMLPHAVPNLYGLIYLWILKKIFRKMSQ